MIKIIDLDIEGTLTGDTRVEEIALVQMPAIEQDFIYFTQQEFVDSISDYPQYITETAQRAKKWVDENGYGSCMTPVGKSRLNQLAKGEPLSIETLKRMKAFGSRHKKDWDSSKSFDEGCGYLALASWGFEPSTYDSVMNYLERVITKEEMAEVGPRGGIRESKKAPKSNTPNPEPKKGEGTAKGDASGKRGAKVTAEQEKTLQKKVDDFNEKESNTKYGRATLGQLKSVFQRGLGAFNTSHSPRVSSAEQWAYARVNAYLYLLKNGRPQNPKYKTDNDLLPEKHPKAGKGKEDMDIDVSNLPDYVNYPSGDTENDMLIKPVLFVERAPDEDRSDYINRCTEYLIKNEGKEPDQAYAICNSEADEYSLGQNVSFDFDDTLNTPRGRGLALHELQSGSDVYIISARADKMRMMPLANELGIPEDRVFATGSNTAKLQKIKDLRIDKHYDNNEDVIDTLGRVGIQFMCPCLDEFVDRKQGFTMIGFIDGEPVFTTPQEAELYGEKEHGCSGHHTHTDDDGNTVYMGCEMHPEMMEQEFGVEDYSDEEKEIVELLKFLKDNHKEEFEAVVGELKGATLEQVKRRNHKTATPYYQYKRVLNGSPDRDFCMSIEGRYFRRFEIDLLFPLNKEFGHERQPYSKWRFLGGPNCIHAWYRNIAVGRNVQEIGPEPGEPGTPMKSRPLQGYYSEETKRKSEVAYIISQQGMSKMGFKADDEKRMVYSPLMIPNILIPRLSDDGEKYFVKFTPQVIEKIQNLYMIEKRLDKTNYEHTDNKIDSVVMVESWIVSGDSDKSFQLGFSRENIPDGTWMGGFKILDTEEGDYIWNEYIKKGKVKGFSVEGNFIMNFSALKNDEYLLQEIINIIKQIND